jgi:hypothetical protein
MLIRIVDNVVADIYQGLSEETTSQLQGAFPGSQFVETEESVTRGDAWPKITVNPPEPLPTPIKTRESVVMELNSLVDTKKREYLQRWPNTSQSDLWPLFDAELVRIKTDANPSPELYPALVGALSAKIGATPSIEQLQTFADAIIGAKKAHAVELATLENAYQYTLQVFEEDSAIDISQTFEGAYGA